MRRISPTRTASFISGLRPLWRLLLLSLVLPGTAAFGEESPQDHPAYFGELLTSMMQRHDIPGLAAVLVQGDDVVFRAGYGFADVSRQVRVDPERTVFLLGSISKIVTTVGVLQLVESGGIALDADIATYLGDVRLDRRFPEPITTRHLLTHTDGFDVRWLFGGAARVPGKVPPLARYLDPLPPRVMLPGEVYLYGDVGLAVAGHIVEQVSQQPFAEYMERQVFAPLGMQHTTFRSERKSFARDRATGYDYIGSRLRPVPVVYPRATPSSGLTAPIADMAPLMIALLQGGQLGSNRILSEQMTAEMWKKQFSHHPAIAGTAFGCYEYFHRGHRALVHGGLLPGFTSVLILLPELRVGMCVAANRFGLIEPLENELIRAIIERYYPEPAPEAPRPPSVLAGLKSAVDQLAGVYRCDQYSRYSLDKIFVLGGLATEVAVEAQPDGSLVFQPEGSRWVEIEPRLFEKVGTTDRVIFETDDNGRGYRILGSAQFMSYHRVGFLDDVKNTAGITGCLLLLSLIGFAGVFRSRKRSRIEPTAMLKWLRVLGIVLPLITLGYFFGLWETVSKLDFVTAAFGEPRALSLIRNLPAVFAGVALLQIVIALFELYFSGWTSKEPLIYIVAAVATLGVLPMLVYWNLITLPFTMG